MDKSSHYNEPYTAREGPTDSCTGTLRPFEVLSDECLGLLYHFLQGHNVFFIAYGHQLLSYKIVELQYHMKSLDKRVFVFPT